MAGGVELSQRRLGDSGSALPVRLKLARVSWPFLGLIILVACVGFAMLYSAAGGSLEPYASRQIARFGIGLVLLLTLALIDLRFIMMMAYPIYLAAVALLGAVEVFGHVGMGAQRWIDLGFLQLQPSELMKIAILLAMARYFHGLSPDRFGDIRFLIVPGVMIALPVALVLRQPDLGTATMLAVTAVAVWFVAGVSIKLFWAGGAALAVAAPALWMFYLRDYQKDRIMTFLNPESDPLGAGYHIMQSKIALGSGGMSGRGFLQGTQSHLSFLPESQTDFVFTMLAEEFGLIGGLGLLGLYALIILVSLVIAWQARSPFARLLGAGLTVNFFLYVLINVAMVTGLVPVVGVPLPLVSYGGTAMLTLMIGFGLLMNVQVHRDRDLPRGDAAIL